MLSQSPLKEIDYHNLWINLSLVKGFHCLYVIGCKVFMKANTTQNSNSVFGLEFHLCNVTVQPANKPRFKVTSFCCNVLMQRPSPVMMLRFFLTTITGELSNSKLPNKQGSNNMFLITKRGKLLDADWLLRQDSFP